MNAPSRIPPLTTLPAAAAAHNLDNAALQRLRRLLRGRMVLPRIFGRPYRYTVADVEHVIKVDRSRRAGFPPLEDVHRCHCGRMFVSAECLSRHVAREHAS